MITETLEAPQTLAEYKAERLAPPKEPEKVEAKAEPEVVVEVEDEPKDESKEEPKKGNAKLQGRFSELTEQRRQAEQRADREAERAAAAERERDELKAKLAPPIETVDAPEPKPADYADAFKYAADLAEWTAQKVLKDRDKADEAKVQKAEAEKVTAAWKERLAEAKAKYPDWEDVVTSSEMQVSNPVRDALIESEQGPELVRMLALDPKLVEKINKLSIVGQLKELGRLEATLDKPPEVKAEKVEPVERPRAPAPITPVKGTKSADNPTQTPGEFTGTYQEWRAARARTQKH